ncbi:MAG: transposase [Beutenbergiaceae bacterium]
MRVRVIDAEITITTDAGQQRGAYRLLTSLTDPVRYRAEELIRLYHERWEIETSFLELKSSMLGGRVLRARTATGIDQEIYALLVTYQLLRTVISDATSATGTDPDRGSFSIAWQAARDQVILARHAIAGTVIDLVGTIGTAVMAALLPPRRVRVSPRVVKRAISKYQARGPFIDRTCRQASLKITSSAASRHDNHHNTLTTRPCG